MEQIDWECPECGEGNSGIVFMDLPECEWCGAEFDWEDILDDFETYNMYKDANELNLTDE